MIVKFDNDSFVGVGHYRAESKFLVLDLSALIKIRHNLCWDHSFEVVACRRKVEGGVANLRLHSTMTESAVLDGWRAGGRKLELVFELLQRDLDQLRAGADAELLADVAE